MEATLASAGERGGTLSKPANPSETHRGHPRLFPVALFLPVNLFAVAIIVVSLAGNNVAFSGANVVAVAPFLAPPVYFALRSVFIGVWLDSRHLRCVSWFRAYKYSIADVRRIDAVDYNGVFTGGRDSSLASMLCVTLADGRVRNVRGSISSPSAMRQEVRRLRAMIANSRAVQTG